MVLLVWIKLLSHDAVGCATAVVSCETSFTRTCSSHAWNNILLTWTHYHSYLHYVCLPHAEQLYMFQDQTLPHSFNQSSNWFDEKKQCTIIWISDCFLWTAHSLLPLLASSKALIRTSLLIYYSVYPLHHRRLRLPLSNSAIWKAHFRAIQKWVREREREGLEINCTLNHSRAGTIKSDWH
jgi:hypothetical protein